MDDVISIVSVTMEADENGIEQETKATREVFCSVESVTRAEFFEGGRAGLNPEYVFIVFAADYHGEPIIIYKEKAYAVYRTYHVPGTDYMELYAERKGGTNGKGNAY